ncbi:MAG: DUF4297 domain-containing protein [Plectolyngbya sp. WJT66-NPBG17]|jgi:hypothetical protein|nr:DUF4297 domain-containing protein [Plectolyngbya sp. WJT66-NPBG17]
MMHQKMPKHPNQDSKGVRSPSPSEILDTGDPGDATQRAFRYQHGYGVILLLAGATGSKPYKAIWCEHYEDLLCERDDGLFDGFQIKTRQPENGAWGLTDESFQKSIKRFVHLIENFNEHIHELSFVSNTKFLDVGLDLKDRKKLIRSPRPFLRAVYAANSIEDVSQPFDESFKVLREYCGCSDDLLFETLKRTRLVLGPGLTSFDSDISHDHLPQLAECTKLSPTALNQLRDELIQRVYYASSLYCDHPSRHWRFLDKDSASTPELLGKKLGIEVVSECVREYKNTPFRYSPGLSEMEIKTGNNEYSKLKIKMVRGGLARQFDTMQRRTICTEQKLIELQYSKPEEFCLILNQLACVVQAECDEAQLQASLRGLPYGGLMMNDVYERLKNLSKEEPAKVEHLHYECLVGMAGLLTEECKVWWSEEFDLGAAL